MDANDLKPAIEALKAGRAVVFPTDTVCGLGVAVRYAESPREIFELKRRPAGKPVAWLVGGLDDLDRFGTDVSPQARELAERGWPGALTVIVKASEAVPPAVRSQQGTIGLRMPASETALALIREAGPLATSSANRSADEPPRLIEDVDPGILSEVAAVVRASEAGSGTASTVIDATVPDPVVLRA